MFDFQAQPGLYFVWATLLPLASFVLLLLAGGLKQALRPYRDGVCGGLFTALGGHKPTKNGAYVATAAIAGAFLLCLAGAVQFFPSQATRHQKHEALEKVEKQLHADEDNTALRAEAAQLMQEIAEGDAQWSRRWDWAMIGAPAASVADQKPASLLQIGFRIDHLSAVMFLMVTFIATLIHLFSIGYMSEELDAEVADHHVHTEDGHLHRRGRFGRFFLFLSLFCFSMLNLLLADNLFQIFVSWELVGICSFLLIGFYYERTSASYASNKAFITNRVGDAGFILGLLILWTYVGTFNFEDIFARIRCPEHHSHGEASLAAQIVRAEPVVLEGAEPARKGRQVLRIHKHDDPVTASTVAVLMPRLIPGQFEPQNHEGPHNVKQPRRNKGHFHAPGHDEDKEEQSEIRAAVNPSAREYGFLPYWMLVVAGLGIFLGCVGKSAQFPLQVWLPDAMEGPTPVSALIHAATMVAAGVYLVGRCFPLFTSEVLLVISYTGAITLFVAATIAIVMTDIKKVLAYSTVSQLGYMMLALGIGGWVAGLFHLVTHAFFKALLFLGSGSVIYGCHHEQEMTKMGGLFPKMKITALTMLVGVLAIAGIPLFSGWYSKDAILAQAIGFVMVHPQHVLLFVLPLLTAGITTFYMFRMWLMTFTGQPRDHHVYEHAHESPNLMTIPLILLAFFSICVAWGAKPWDAHYSFLGDQIHHAQPVSVRADFGALPDGHEPLTPTKPQANSERFQGALYGHTVGNIALGVVLLAIFFAFTVYYFGWLDPAEAKEQFPGVHRFLAHKWYFDELYSVMLVRPALAVGGWFRSFDLKGIDGVLHGAANLGVWTSKVHGLADKYIIDGVANLLATVSYAIGGWFRTWQTGYLRSYVLFLALAAVGLFALFAFFVTRGMAGN